MPLNFRSVSLILLEIYIEMLSQAFLKKIYSKSGSAMKNLSQRVKLQWNRVKFILKNKNLSYSLLKG
jgi:hypothetical protein